MKKLIISTLLLLAAISATAAEKYAVLITGDYAKTGSYNNGTGDKNGRMEEFWFDTYLMYEQLRLRGYSDENIYVLFADGVDYQNTAAGVDIANRYKPFEQFGLDHISDMPATLRNVDGVFSQLKSKCTDNDFLFVWTFDHGGTNGNSQSYINLMGSDRLEDYHLKYLSDNITANKKVFWMQRYNAQLVTDH